MKKFSLDAAFSEQHKDLILFKIFIFPETSKLFVSMKKNFILRLDVKMVAYHIKIQQNIFSKTADDKQAC